MDVAHTHQKDGTMTSAGIETNAMTVLGGESGEYLSARGRHPSILARLFPTLFFFPAFWNTVYQSSRLVHQGRYDNAAWAKSSLDVLRAMEYVGATIHISGLNFLHQVSGPCVFVANHMSTLETIVLPGIIQPFKDVTFVVKRVLVQYPIFKEVLLSRDPIVVDRVNPREDLTRVLNQGAELLARGRSIIVFPQTTRTLRFDPAEFNTIGIKLARSANVPIVPVAVRTDAWGIGRWIKDIGRIDPSRPVHFAFGEALEVEGRGAATHQRVIQFITDHLRTWGFDGAHPVVEDAQLPTPTIPS